MPRPILAVTILSLILVAPATAGSGGMSPLEESCARSIEAVADSYIHWTEIVCPIFRDVVEIHVDLGLFDSAELLAEIYANEVWNVADAKIAAIRAIASSCERAGGNVDGFAERAIGDVEEAHDNCVESILSVLEENGEEPEQAPELRWLSPSSGRIEMSNRF